MNNKNKKSRGVTLIETLIYIGITAFLVSSMMLLTQAILNSNVRVKTSIALEENLQFVMVKISQKIQEASNITVPASGAGNNLVLEMSAGLENPTSFSLSGGVILMAEGGGEAVPILSNEIEITNLLFTRLDSSSAAVKIQITGQLRGASPSIQTIHTLSSTIVVRR